MGASGTTALPEDLQGRETMNSVQITERGVVGFGQMPIPQVGADQVLVKVHSAPINPSDCLFMKGAYTMEHDYPFTPGWEGAGTVVQAGPGYMAQNLVGKRVAFSMAAEGKRLRTGGAYAEYILTRSTACLPLDDDISFEQAASTFVNPISALGLVERVQVLKSTATIITAAASQIGRMIIRLCHNAGITPICVVRRDEQVQLLKEQFNVTHVINTSESDWEDKMKQIADELQPNTCLECVAGEMTGKMFNYLSKGGHVILYGLLSEQPVAGLDVVSFIGKDQKLEGWVMPNWLDTKSLWSKISIVKHAKSLIASDLSTVVNKTFGLHQIKEAIEFYKANQTAGKVLLQPGLTPAQE